eukprot:gb/GECG01000240.1/.p1 GENE.gb/GECG01000240.1/~~gb/GECG01000240.1/.p1  ORF type:complete len:148 (+),score=6.52 gb/GECG01000240.1/:1-444(+)
MHRKSCCKQSATGTSLSLSQSIISKPLDKLPIIISANAMRDHISKALVSLKLGCNCFTWKDTSDIRAEFRQRPYASRRTAHIRTSGADPAVFMSARDQKRCLGSTEKYKCYEWGKVVDYPGKLYPSQQVCLVQPAFQLKFYTCTCQD